MSLVAAPRAKFTCITKDAAEIAERARLVMSAADHHCTPVPERRQNKRIAYPYPILFAATDKADPTRFVAIGRHLSELGLDFYSTAPVTHRNLVANISVGRKPICFLLDLTWCRFVHAGMYQNGGRFVGLVDPNDFDWEIDMESVRRFAGA